MHFRSFTNKRCFEEKYCKAKFSPSLQRNCANICVIGDDVKKILTNVKHANGSRFFQPQFVARNGKQSPVDNFHKSDILIINQRYYLKLRVCPLAQT